MADHRSSPNNGSVEVRFVPALQMIVQLHAVGEKDANVNHEVRRTEEATSWRDSVKACVSPFELADVQLLFAFPSITVFLMYLVFQEGNWEVDDLIAALADLSPETLQTRFRRFLKIDDETERWLDVDVIEEALAADRAEERVSFREEAGHLVRLLSSADALHRKLIDVLTWFDRRVFRPTVAEIRTRADSWITETVPAIKAEPRTLLDHVTKDSFDSLLSDREEVYLFPVIGGQEDETWMMIPDNAYIVFDMEGADRAIRPGGQKVDEGKTDGRVEALADPKRIAILRFLRERPHFGREIADHLGVSASTASYHIDKLVAARLVHLEVSSGRRLYYAINQQGFTDLLSRLREEFVDGT